MPTIGIILIIVLGAIALYATWMVIYSRSVIKGQNNTIQQLTYFCDSYKKLADRYRARYEHRQALIVELAQASKDCANDHDVIAYLRRIEAILLRGSDAMVVEQQLDELEHDPQMRGIRF